MWAPKQVLNLLSHVSTCHLLNANKEKKYKAVLEIKYNVREDLTETSKTTYWVF